jgi:hypothetical protein
MPPFLIRDDLNKCPQNSKHIKFVGTLTILAGFATNYLVEVADKRLGKEISGPENTDGLAGALAPWLREAGDRLGKIWDWLKEKMPNDYFIGTAPAP